MTRIFYCIIACIIVMFVSCKTNDVENQKIELKNQLIGLTNAHNARQLGGYVIGDKQINLKLPVLVLLL